MPEKNNRTRNYSLSAGAIICAALGVIALAVCAIVLAYTDYDPSTVVLCALGCYGGALVLAGVIGFVNNRMFAGDEGLDIRDHFSRLYPKAVSAGPYL